MRLFTNRHYLLHFSILAFFIFGCASSKTENRPSPLAADSTQIGDAVVKITYSSPGVKKRKIWGNLVPYDHVWRTGANQASFISLSKDLSFDGQRLDSGKYSIFTIPRNTHWVIIFNKDWDQWGAYNYDSSEDALRLKVEPLMIEKYQERMKFSLADSTLSFHWENLTFSIPISTIAP